MKALKIAHILGLWTAIVAVGIIVLATVPAHAQPEVSYWIMSNNGWVPPGIGAPVMGYVIDQSTGKSYLVQRDYWGMSTRIVDSILNKPDDPE